MEGILTTNVIQSINIGDLISNPILQILSFKRIIVFEDDKDRYKIVLSDGDHMQSAILPEKLNDLFFSNTLKIQSVVALTNYISRPTGDSRQSFEFSYFTAIHIYNNFYLKMITNSMTFKLDQLGPSSSSTFKSSMDTGISSGNPSTYTSLKSSKWWKTKHLFHQTRESNLASTHLAKNYHYMRVSTQSRISIYQTRWTIKGRVTTKN